MKTLLSFFSLLASLAHGVRAAEPLRFEEISLLVRMREPDSTISHQLASRRLLRALTPQQEATLKAQGASDTLLQSFRVPSLIYSDTEAAAFEAQREQRKKAEEEAAAAKAAAAPPEQPAKDDFRVMNVRFGQPVNLSQWGGPNNDVTFYAKKQFVGSDLVAAVLTDNTRTFTDSVTTTGANVNAYGAAATTTTVQSSYSPTKVLTINRSSPEIVPGLPTLYPVYESGGVSLYFAHISTEAADSVKLAVKVSKK